MTATVSPFVIRELTGDKREFRFTGRGLPYRPFTLSGDQRADINWYAGSPEGTIQMLGAKENETTINGMWKDRFLRQVVDMSPAELVAAGFDVVGGNAAPFSLAAGQSGEPGAKINGFPINNVRELADTVDDVRRKGQLVEVTWLHIKRQGIIRTFRQSWHAAQDLEWEIRFEWINQGFQLSDVPIQDRSVDLSDTVVEISNQLEELDGIMDGSASLDLQGDSGQAFTQAGQALDEVNQGINQIQQALTQLQDTVINNTQALLSPISTVQRSIGIFSFMKDVGDSTANGIDRRLDAAILNVQDTFGTKLDQRNTLSKQRRAARRISAVAAIRQAQLEKQARPELISSFVAREDQDLRDVALQHYGTADEWKSLMRFNNLDESRLSSNQLIFVPRNPPRGDQC